jgi:hypothetical protein
MSKLFLTAAVAATLFATASATVLAQQPAPGPKSGGHCCSATDTPGWGMMNAEERKKHQEKMGGFKDKGSCMAYMGEHHKAMEARAKEKGQKMPMAGGHGCDHLK